jgi:hypothetical protein
MGEAFSIASAFGTEVSKKSMGQKRARRIKRRKNSAQPRNPPQGFLKNNLVALISLVVTLVIAVVTYKWTVLEPDLRATKHFIGGDATGSSTGVRDPSGNCVYHRWMRVPFKNVSFRSGFIDNITFSNESFDILPEYELIEIDKTPIGWTEERAIQFKYRFKADPATCDKLSKKEAIEVGIRFYDNTGKLISLDVEGNSWDFGLWKD